MSFALTGVANWRGSLPKNIRNPVFLLLSTFMPWSWLSNSKKMPLTWEKTCRAQGCGFGSMPPRKNSKWLLGLTQKIVRELNLMPAPALYFAMAPCEPPSA